MPKRILEAALFVADRPMRVEELSKVSGHAPGHVRKALGELAREYEGGALEIAETPEGWHMRVKHEILPRVAHLTPHSDLSEGCKRALALILYKEPVKQSEIVKMQGNKAYGYVKRLQKKGLVKACKKGHTMVLELTQEFENYFGERKEKLRGRLEEAIKSGHAGVAGGDIMDAVEEFGGRGPRMPEKRGKDIEDIIEKMRRPAVTDGPAGAEKGAVGGFGEDEPEEIEPEEEEEKPARAAAGAPEGSKPGVKAKEKVTRKGGARVLVWSRGK
jgi:segregation and condensation protein B